MLKWVWYKFLELFNSRTWKVRVNMVKLKRKVQFWYALDYGICFRIRYLREGKCRSAEDSLLFRWMQMCMASLQNYFECFYGYNTLLISIVSIFDIRNYCFLQLMLTQFELYNLNCENKKRKFVRNGNKNESFYVRFPT